MARLFGSLASAALTLAVLTPCTALAGDPPTAPADPKPPPAATKPDEKPAASEPEYKGTEIRWAISFTEALEEAAERNIPIYLHSHGST